MLIAKSSRSWAEEILERMPLDRIRAVAARRLSPEELEAIAAAKRQQAEQNGSK